MVVGGLVEHKEYRVVLQHRNFRRKTSEKDWPASRPVYLKTIKIRLVYAMPPKASPDAEKTRQVMVIRPVTTAHSILFSL